MSHDIPNSGANPLLTVKWTAYTMAIVAVSLTAGLAFKVGRLMRDATI